MKFFKKYNDLELAVLIKEHMENKHDKVEMSEDDWMYHVFAEYEKETGKDFNDFYLSLLLEISNRFRIANRQPCYFE